MEEKHRIMVVDDDADIRLIIEAALTPKYEIVHASDGLDALQKLEKYEPDFIIMDMVMPLMSGLEACEAIRHNSKFQNIQVLFLSAHDTRVDIAKTYESGGDLFLSKPIESSRLLRNVDVFFEKSKAPPRPKTLSMRQIQASEHGRRERHAPPPPPPPEAPASQTPLYARRDPATGARGGAQAQPRVLVVEDDKNLADLICVAISDHFEVAAAYDGLDAVEKIVKYQPDILLLDVMLPRMNGYQLCQSVRANRAFSHMPIIFVTAKSTAKDREYAIRVGGDGFLAKPFEMKELLEMCLNITKRVGFEIRPKTLTKEQIRTTTTQERVAARHHSPFEKRGRIV